MSLETIEALHNTPVVREMSAGMTARGEVVHAAWREPSEPAFAFSEITLSPLCRRVFITSPRPAAAVSCQWCIRKLYPVDRADEQVMHIGLPGGHPSQHDRGCRMACDCGPDPDLHQHCRRHGVEWIDPEARLINRVDGCQRLPGCHCPQQEVGADG